MTEQSRRKILSKRTMNESTTHQLGAHLSIAGGPVNATKAAIELGCTALQIFTKSNARWDARPLRDAEVEAFRGGLVEAGIDRPVAHASYLINLGSADDALWNKSIDALTLELGRAEALGITSLVVHPGTHGGSGVEPGLARVAAGIDQVHQRTEGFKVRLTIENTAGQGTSLGDSLDQLGTIINAVQSPDRLMCCLDTCHLFAAGYPIQNVPGIEKAIALFDEVVGLDRLAVWHLNDSLKPFGSRVDRHAGLGRGEIGLDPFRWIVSDPRFLQVPMILETPKGEENGQDLDAINLQILRSMASESSLTGTS